MEEELRTYLKSNDLRLINIESSIKTINHELGDISGQLKMMPKNGRVNPTVNLIVKWIVTPLILILGTLWGVSNVTLGG